MNRMAVIQKVNPNNPLEFTDAQRHALCGSRLFAGIPEAGVHTILRQCAVCRALKNKDVLLYEGKSAAHWWILLEGRLDSYRFEDSIAGKFYIDSFLAGDFIGLDIYYSDPGESPVRIIAGGPCVLAEFAASALDGIELPGIRKTLERNFKTVFSNNSMRMLYRVNALTVKPLRKQIIVFLLNMRAKKGSDTFYVNMNREQLAGYFGVHANSLIRELKGMQDAGFIECEGQYFTVHPDAFKKCEALGLTFDPMWESADGNSGPA
ncbi:MAG: Crp/Fnr family transcriptional regulator [Clostridiales Family XIII bacterium]|jgi:CRP-like cAMP-binding protein|nr:Crp/Fnr family transcriptional regulator [Clostridiales Family XIII bacterium]